MNGARWIRMIDGRAFPTAYCRNSARVAGKMVEIWSKSDRIRKMKAFPIRKSTQQKVPVQKHDSRISGESSGRPKLFAATDTPLNYSTRPAEDSISEASLRSMIFLFRSSLA